MPEGELPPTRARLTLSEEQRLQWLMLIRSENVGPATFRDLVNHFGSAAAALEALPALAQRGGTASRIRIATRAEAEAELDRAERVGARFIGLGEPDYPPLLRGLDHPPPLICVMGAAPLLCRRPIGIVGSRNASASGQKFAARMARQLGEAGMAVVSGLARGIDAAAHQAALEQGTVGVMAGGIDIPFPPEHAGLAREIVDQGGALVSEMPVGWNPRAVDFPRRNRLIAGLSLGVLVVEAARRSGSLITARLATENGRLVFAVPGSPLDPRAEGTNHLIRMGATLVTCAEEILEGINPMAGPDPQLPFDAGEAEPADYEPAKRPATDASEFMRSRIIEALGPSPCEIDDLLRFTGASTGEIQLVLLELALAGRLERHPGNRVSLMPAVAV